MKWVIVPILVMGTAAGFIHWQGLAMGGLSIVFGATDGAQEFLKANPANPHPSVKLPAE